MPVDTAIATPIGDTVSEAKHGWLTAARLYAGALAAGHIPGVRPLSLAGRRSAHSEPRLASIRIDLHDLPALAETLEDTYRRLAPGDVAVLDVAIDVRAVGAGGRETVACALWRAGFDCPLIWASREILSAEPPVRLLARLLPSRALGAGPQLPAAATPLARPDRLLAMARRGDLAPPRERMIRLSVVLPVYNEQATFRDVIGQLLAKEIPGYEIEICLVESNSTDGTRDEVLLYADHPRVRLALEDKPSGKGHAVRKGFELATGDIVLIQDADLEYDLEDYEKLLAPIRDGEVGFVLGSRHAAHGAKSWQIRQFATQRHSAALMNVGHLLFTSLFNWVFGQKLRDPFTMYKVFLRGAIHNVRFECNRFDFDFELAGKLIRQGYNPREIPVSYRSRSFKEGKKVSPLGDPPTWLKACARHRFSRLHIWPGSP
jgi:hypothetical protein